MSVFRLANGGKFHSFPPPPHDFEPSKVDDHELALHGFPRRPKGNKHLLKRWENLFRGKIHYLQAEVHPSGGRHHGHGRSPVIDAAPYDRINWAGIDVRPPGQDQIATVCGEWTVPNVHTPAKQANGKHYYCASWVGIGGLLGSVQFFQAGVETDVITLPNKTVMHNTKAWFEFIVSSSGTPVESEQVVANFPVKPGDQIGVCVCLDPKDHTKGYVYFHNKTTAHGTSVMVQEPPGVGPLFGNTAEWIVERPHVNSAVSDLASFGTVVFQNAFAMTATDEVIDPNGSPLMDTIDMYDDPASPKKILLAHGSVSGAEEVKVECKVA